MNRFILAVAASLVGAWLLAGEPAPPLRDVQWSIIDVTPPQTVEITTTVDEPAHQATPTNGLFGGQSLPATQSVCANGSCGAMRLERHVVGERFRVRQLFGRRSR